MLARTAASSSPVNEAGLRAFRLRLSGDSFEPARLAAALPSLVSQRISLEIASAAGEVALTLCGSAGQAYVTAGLFSSCWPGVSTSPEAVTAFTPPVAGWQVHPRLADALPLMPANEKQFDLPTSLLSLLARADSLNAAFQVVIEPFVDPSWRERAMVEAERLTRPEQTLLQALASTFLDVSPPPMPSLKWLNALQQDAYAKAASQFLFRASIRFVVSGQPAALVRKVAMEALHLMHGAFAEGANGVVPIAIPSAEQLCRDFNRRNLNASAVFRAEELTALWHPPRHLQEAPWLRSAPRLFVRSPEVAAAKTVPTAGVQIGYDSVDGGRTIALPAATFRQQTAIVGATGTGKSTAALTIFLSAVTQGLGGLLLDVKGDLALDAIGRMPESRVDEVIFIDGADEDCGWSVDPMGLARTIDRDLSADILVSCFEKEFRDSWGVVIERLMKHRYARSSKLMGQRCWTCLVFSATKHSVRPSSIKCRTKWFATTSCWSSNR
jgi:hypothetical protein